MTVSGMYLIVGLNAFTTVITISTDTKPSQAVRIAKRINSCSRCYFQVLLK
jgi:hypothetical protein